MKEIKIKPPDGYEIDRENSTFDCIRFKPSNHNQITQSEACDDDYNIGDLWAFSLFETERQGGHYSGSCVSGHKASIYLCSSYGDWYNEDGEKIRGHLYYKLKK